MKRAVVIGLILAVVMVVPMAFALNDLEQNQGQGQVGINKNDLDNTNQQGQGQGQIGINKNDLQNTNQQGQGQSQIGVNKNYNSDFNTNKQAQGQGQGQMQGQGQGQGQGQFAVGAVKVQDNSTYKSKAYSFGPPGLSANKGVNEGNIYSIFGGIGLSEDAEYTVCIEKLSVIERLKAQGILTDEEAVVEGRKAYKQLLQATQPKRLLGLLWETRGRNLLNLFGFLSFDSFYRESPPIGETEFPKKEKVVEDSPDVEPTTNFTHR